MTMELKVLEQVQKLSWNFEDVKKELANHIEQYVGLAANDENLKSMEHTQKEIASLRTKIQKFRLAVKKDLEKPYNVFELQIKELVALVESAEKPIKDQLQKYEDARREAMRLKVQNMICEISSELGLTEKYSEQIVVADKYLNRTQKVTDTKEDIQTKVCWFLDIQTKEIADEAARIEKVNMAKMMCEFLSKDLVTPYLFQDIQHHIDQMNITELRTHIENQVAIRKEREERAIEQARLVEEQKRIAELAKQEQAEQSRIAEELAKHTAVDIESTEILLPPQTKLHNAQFVLYGVTDQEIELVKILLNNHCLNFKYHVKDAD